MGACQTVRRWMTENVLMPVTRFITEARQVCQEIGHWVEENVTKPVEKFISKVEEFCHDLLGNLALCLAANGQPEMAATIREKANAILREIDDFRDWTQSVGAAL